MEWLPDHIRQGNDPRLLHFLFLFLIFQIIVPLYQMNQNNIEETADIAKINIKDRLEMVLRRDKFELKRL